MMSNPSPGWYPDPTAEGSLRFFDGENWTQSSVPTPEDGQLSRAMIAAGRKIMQERSTQKFRDTLTPRTIGEPDPLGEAPTHSGEPVLDSAVPEAVDAQTPVDAGVTQVTEESDGVDQLEQEELVNQAEPVELSSATSNLEPEDVPTTDPHETVVAPFAETSRFEPVSATPAAQFSPSTPSPLEPASDDSEETLSTPKWSVVGEGPESNSFSATQDSLEIQPQAQGSGGWLKSNKWVIALIAGLLVIGVAVFALVKAFDKDDTIGAEPSKDYQELGLKSTFDCDALAEEVISLSRETPDEIAISSIEDTKMVVDNRSEFKLPGSANSFEAAFECSGTAYHEDGKNSAITFSIDVDKDRNFWTSYDQRKN